MKLRKILFTLVLAFPLSNISLAKLNSQVLPNSNELRKMEAEDRARQHESKNQHRQDIAKPISTSGLDKQKQIEELNKTILYMDGNENYINFFHMMLKSATVHPKNQDKVPCLLSKLQYDNYKSYTYNLSKNYVLAHSAQQVSEELKLLINSGLGQELHDRTLDLIAAKNSEEKKMVGYDMQLHMMQQPAFTEAIYQITHNPKYKDLNQLLGFDKPAYNAIIVRFFNESANQCNFEMNPIKK